MKTTTKVMIALGVAMVATTVGVLFYLSSKSDREMEAYRSAIESEEPAVMNSYLELFPDAPVAHRDSVMLLLSRFERTEKEWRDAVASGTRRAIEEFLRLYPKTIHLIEAKVKLDSIDWQRVMTERTAEAVQAYLRNHPDGEHSYEAKDLAEQLENKAVSSEEQLTVESIVMHFFYAIAEQNELMLTDVVDNVMKNFLHKNNATKNDVIAYMNKQYAPEDIVSMSFRSNNDWEVEKVMTDDGSYYFDVKGSVDQRINRTDNSREGFVTLKVHAVLTANQKITELNLQKLHP